MHISALPFFGLIRVSGEDRASFLHGQLSNHIEGLAEGEACYATYNTPKGRVIANMLVFNRGEDLLPSTPRQLALYEALKAIGVAHHTPQFGHLPFVMGEGNKKMPGTREINVGST